eukprot:1143629-Alexandrium_andersonii.AAC.1
MVCLLDEWGLEHGVIKVLLHTARNMWLKVSASMEKEHRPLIALGWVAAQTQGVSIHVYTYVYT